MIEIVRLIFFTRRLGRIAEEKGHKPRRYRTIAILSWFGAEIVGFIVGALLFSESGGLMYGAALLFAAISALIVYLAVKNLPEQAVPGIEQAAAQQWKCPQCGAENTSWDQKCIGCGIPKPVPVAQAT
jgi:hypothetical protein